MKPMRPMKPRLALSIGCPGGVGAEVTLAALASEQGARCEVVLFGDVRLLVERAKSVGFDATRIVRLRSPSRADAAPEGAIGVVETGAPLDDDARAPGRSTRAGGAAQLAWIDAACDATSRGDADALVTAPASKESIASSAQHRDSPAGRFLGHTEHLGARLGARETVMAFVAEQLTITLATTHLPLSRVAATLSIEYVARAAYWTARLADDLSLDPALAVAILALNPHAGEKGLLGDEEAAVITPGIDRARARLSAESRGRALVGPLPAESAIRQTATSRAYAACVAMYHDQATIPSKLLAFGDAVNVTLGLPIVRTSVDHGTAYDLAGTGKADARGMIAAIELARRLLSRSASRSA